MTDGQGFDHLKKLATLVRYYSLACTTKAGSGHPTSSLSATDLMVGLMFGGGVPLRRRPARTSQQRSSDLFQGSCFAAVLFALAGGREGLRGRDDDLPPVRQPPGRPSDRGVPLHGGSDGLAGARPAHRLGMALNAKYLDRLPYRTYVLLGDSEMAEGSQWEAMQIAAHYGLGNLVGDPRRESAGAARPDHVRLGPGRLSGACERIRLGCHRDRRPPIPRHPRCVRTSRAGYRPPHHDHR